MNKTTLRFMSLIAVIAVAFSGGFTTAAFAAPDTHVSEHQMRMLVPKTYYVSPAGSDSNSGSAAAPFKTLAKATSVLKAGDTLQAMAGTYTETLILPASGTASAPISVIGNGAVLNMQSGKQNGITISGSYINVSGFEIIGATDFGILITGANITVEDNVLHDNVTRNGVGVCGISSSWGSALKVKDGGGNIAIRTNTVYDNCGEGIAITRSATVLIDANTVYDNFGVNIYIDNSPFATIRNNVSYCTGTHLRDGNRATGIALGEEYYAGWGAQLHDITMSGNTIRDCRTGIAAFESNVGGTLTNVTMTGNNVPSGEKRSISLQTLANRNVLISNNTVFNSVYVYQSSGVTLSNNVIAGEAPAPTCSSTFNTPCTFLDVPPTHPYFREIEALYAAGLTGGCGTNPMTFCPSTFMSRAQIAVFTLRGEFGSDYMPPGPPYVFQDNWRNAPWGEAWATGMYQKGLTAGCSASPLLFCPDILSSRGQIAVLGLRLKYGSAYFPPPATGTVFADLTDTSFWATSWAEQAYADGLVPDCGIDAASGKPRFCVDELVNRGFGAYVIAKAKGLVP